MISCSFQVASAAFTHQGNVRDHNEDACVDVGEKNVWVVADGMGGHDQGDYASQLIVERMRDIPELDRPSEVVDLMEDRLLAVNRHLFDKSRAGAQPTVIGSTVVALTVFDRYGITIWAGDSRAYRLRNGELTRVSRDHSEVQTLIDQGLVEEHEAESHPQANVITRAVGGMDELYLDYELRELATGDRYLLCSDGLYKELSDEEIGQRLADGDCRQAAMELLNTALSRECSDNVTVLVVDILDEKATDAADDSPDGNGAE